MRKLKTVLLLASVLAPISALAASSAVLGWNNLGMHCMDSDYSVFSVLPPYNTIECQLIVGGRLVTSSLYSVTYEAVADPSGSFNSTAIGKGNFYQYAGPLYGAVNLPPEHGLAGWSMPGPGNVPQAMLFEVTNHPAAGVATPVNWFRAEGIPIAPYDDTHAKNPYPMMRLVARDSANQILATSDIVLPVSDEMDCRLCHASGTSPAAMPNAGWVWDGLPERDFRLNILRRHDEREFALHGGVYAEALAGRGFNSAGLYRSVTADGKPVLCAACHASEALGAPSFPPSVPALTASVHAFHADVQDPFLNTTLDNSANRAACYRCHPGATTRCLRGAMGTAVAPDGSMEMQCQSCHGNMSRVGDPTRVGWFMEPVCQSCHSGTAMSNNGQIRYTSAFDTTGQPRVAVNQTFATQPNTPATGISLFRFSAGHGGLQCEACHGSTHAEFPSSHGNDNLRNLSLQGHSGVTIECTACHTTTPNTPNRGPHGMHAIGQGWVTGGGGVTKHADFLGSVGGPTACQPCHGLDYMGTALSRAKANRTLQANFDQGSITVQLFPGAGIGCYNCHNGPFSESLNTATAPSVVNASANTSNDSPAAIPLSITGAGATARILTQPAHGSVGISGATATYFPEAGFVGVETFTFAAYDGHKNSNVGTVTVTVTQGAFSFAVTATVPPAGAAAWPVAFAAYPSVTNYSGKPSFAWDFGDGSASAVQFTSHSYAVPGTYSWQLISTLGGLSKTNSGTVVVSGPMGLAQTVSAGQVTLSWPKTEQDALLETASDIAMTGTWQWVTNTPVAQGATYSVTLPVGAQTFYRLRRAW